MITLKEVTSAIKMLWNGHAVHPDCIASELLNPLSCTLHNLFRGSGHVPAEWLDGIIISLYKGRGLKTACSSYWPITLLSIPGKIFPNLLLAHIQPILLTTCMPQWSEFTPVSPPSLILALRLLSELHRRAVCSKGIPNILLHRIEDLHRNTGACVCIGGKLLLRFKLSFWCKAGLRSFPSLVLCHGGLSSDDFDERNEQRHLIWFGC